jgi:CheY-like chemotaxis protein
MTEKKTYQILVAEDNQADVTLVLDALRHHGLDCHINLISDGAEVIDYLRGLDLNSGCLAPDLVMLDMHLPKCDGEDILKALRSTERSAQTPVVVMTSSPATEFEKIAQKHAALYYFRKPSSLDEYMHLGNIVRNILENAKPSGGETDQTWSTT